MCMQCGYKFNGDFEICPLCGVNFKEINPEKVGFFGDRSKQKEIQHKYEKKFNVSITELENNLKIKKFLEEYNFNWGIWFHVYFPEEEIILKHHSAFTRGIATLSLGLVGFAATSGVNLESRQKDAYCIVKVVDGGIILEVTKEYIFDSTVIKEVRIPFEEVKCIKETSQNKGIFELILVNNKKIKLDYAGFPIKYKERKNYEVQLNGLFNYIVDTINKNAKGNLDFDNNSNSKNENIINSMDDLDKLIDMYEKNLLTEEEFNIMKKRIIGDVNKDTQITNNLSPKFCGNCGAEIIDDSNFCIKCGTKFN